MSSPETPQGTRTRSTARHEQAGKCNEPERQEEEAPVPNVPQAPQAPQAMQAAAA